MVQQGTEQLREKFLDRKPMVQEQGTVEQLREKLLAKLERENQKRAILKGFDTVGIADRIETAEIEYERALREDAAFRGQNIGYLAAYGSDCSEVEHILAELYLSCDLAGADGKKATIDEKKAWLRIQRKKHPGLMKAIQIQNDITFQTENSRINIEMAKKRLDGLRAVLALKTAQIEYLAERI